VNGGRLARPIWLGLSWLDAKVSRLWGWRGNPLYQSGSIAVLMLVVMVVTGVYVLVFYRLSAPYASILRLQTQWWAGRWMRALHRYSADAALLAVVVHATRMFAERRSWGPRALAWLSGVFLAGLFLICGWTGYVMVWDTQGQLIALEGARMLDRLPIFSEPLIRTFVGERPLPTAFFFLNLFAHVALPVGFLLALWLHVSRVARPVLFPSRRLVVPLTLILLVMSIVFPAPLGPAGDVMAVPGRAPIDLFYSYWLPLAARVPPAVTLVSGLAVGLLLLAVPVWTRPAKLRAPAASVVDEHLCTGCEQCYQDCPYEAIRMVTRSDGRPTLVARVDPALCVSCGICAGSCAPMGVGPPGRTGRDQLSAVREFVSMNRPESSDVVLVACDRGPVTAPVFEKSRVFPVGCAGNLHTSVVEYLLRAGFPGVMVVACPPRDCWNREGPKWLEQRLFHDREAELQARVDRARVRLVWAARGEAVAAEHELRAFRNAVGLLARTDAETAIDIVAECEPGEAGVIT
jgi:ferredoxin